MTPLTRRAKDRPFRGEQGFTIIELVLVIAAIAVLLAVITAGIGVLNTAKLGRSEQDLQTILSAGQAYQAQQATPTYAGISFAELAARGLVPANASDLNPWGNLYQITGAGDALTISTDTSDATRCRILADRFASRVTSATCAAGALTVVI